MEEIRIQFENEEIEKEKLRMQMELGEKQKNRGNMQKDKEIKLFTGDKKEIEQNLSHEEKLGIRLVHSTLESIRRAHDFKEDPNAVSKMQMNNNGLQKNNYTSDKRDKKIIDLSQTSEKRKKLENENFPI